MQSPQILVRNRGTSNVGQMFGERLPILLEAIPTIVRDSFRAGRHPMNDNANIPEAEKKRRVEFVWETAKEMRKALQWPVGRIINSLPSALDAFLSGRTWEPEDRKIWVPSDGR